MHENNECMLHRENSSPVCGVRERRMKQEKNRFLMSPNELLFMCQLDRCEIGELSTKVHLRKMAEVRLVLVNCFFLANKRQKVATI